MVSIFFPQNSCFFGFFERKPFQNLAQRVSNVIFKIFSWLTNFYSTKFFFKSSLLSKKIDCSQSPKNEIGIVTQPSSPTRIEPHFLEDTRFFDELTDFTFAKDVSGADFNFPMIDTEISPKSEEQELFSMNEEDLVNQLFDRLRDFKEWCLEDSEDTFPQLDGLSDEDLYALLEEAHS